MIYFMYRHNAGIAHKRFQRHTLHDWLTTSRSLELAPVHTSIEFGFRSCCACCAQILVHCIIYNGYHYTVYTCNRQKGFQMFIKYFHRLNAWHTHYKRRITMSQHSQRTQNRCMYANIVCVSQFSLMIFSKKKKIISSVWFSIARAKQISKPKMRRYIKRAATLLGKFVGMSVRIGNRWIFSADDAVTMPLHS